MRDARALRLLLGYAGIACALPYLALKLVWLGGGDLGVSDPAMMREPSMVAINAATAGMDLVGIGITLAFTHRWGLRVPAWVVLPPMWVATGLLSRFVVAVPLTVLWGALAASSPIRGAGGPVEPWVYVVVYTGFAGLGVGMMLAFFFHARVRWADVWTGPSAGGPGEVVQRVRAPLANAAALMAGGLALLHLAWASGLPLGRGGEAVSRRTFVSSLLDGLDAATMAAAAAGVALLVHRFERRVPFGLALGMAWVGSGSLFAWGLWEMVLVLGRSPLLRDAERSALVDLAGLLRLVAGLVGGMLMLWVVAERSSAGTSDGPEPAAPRPRFRGPGA